MGRSNHIPVPLPLRGLNTIDPFADWDSGYAREFTNYMLYNGRVSMRPSCLGGASNASLSTTGVSWFDLSTANSTGYAILDDGKIRALFDGSGAATIGGSPAYNATRCKHVSLDLVIGCREPRDAVNPFTAWTFTTLAITATSIKAACSHKGRLYVADDSTVEYSSVGAVTGTMAGSFPLSYFLDGQKISRIFSVTVNPSISTENVLVIFGDGGKVLVYAGDNPIASNWQLIGKFDMPIPISNVGFVEIDGDIWVSTQKYAYWFRALFSGGAQTAYANSPTLPIENLWATIGVWSSNVSLPEVSHSFYEPYTDSIITQTSSGLETIANYQSEGYYLVYLRKYNAWALWIMTPLFAPIIQDSSGAGVFGTSYAAALKYLATSPYADGSIEVVDRYGIPSTSKIPIETSWKTPYFTSKGAVHKLNGVRVFWEQKNYLNTIAGYFYKLRTIFDYSDYNSKYGWYTQSTVTQSDPGNFNQSDANLTANTASQYNTMIGAAGVGGAFSIQFSQKSSSAAQAITEAQTHNIYAATCLVEEGSEVF